MATTFSVAMCFCELWSESACVEVDAPFFFSFFSATSVNPDDDINDLCRGGMLSVVTFTNTCPKITFGVITTRTLTTCFNAFLKKKNNDNNSKR